MPETLLGIINAHSPREAASPSLLHHLPELARQPYWHPDQIKHKTAPAGLRHDQWWPLLKCLRVARWQPLPPLGFGGTSFGLVHTECMRPILHHFDRHGSLDGPKASGQQLELRQSHRIAAMMDEALASAELAGERVNRETCREMLRSGRHPLHQSEQRVANLYRQLKQLPDRADTPMTPATVRALHEKLVEHVVVADAPVPEAPDLTALCRFAEGGEGPFLHPLLRAIIVQFYVLHFRPFGSGGDVTARFLMQWTALRHGYRLFAHLAPSQALLEDRASYESAISHVLSDDGDVTYFLLPVLNALQRALTRADEAIRRSEEEILTGRQAWNRFGFLNPRQEDIVMRAIKKPGAVFTIEAHRESHDLAYATARADLLRLEQIGLMNKRQRGKGFVFETAPNWLEKLQRLSDES